MISDNRENTIDFILTVVTAVKPTVYVWFEDHPLNVNWMVYHLRDTFTSSDVATLVRLGEDSDETLTSNLNMTITLLDMAIADAIPGGENA